MKNSSAKIDAYIEKAEEFARPILQHVRNLFHKACPDIEETMKWSFPHFEFQGLVANMAAFKKHVRIGFWKASLMSDAGGLLKGDGATSMGAIKVGDLSELPSDKTLTAYIKEAVKLNMDGVKAAPSRKPAKKEIAIPDDLQAALAKNKKALATFEGFSPSHKREYLEWIVEAKRQATREKRIATAIEWLSTGKPRNWKYMK